METCNLLGHSFADGLLKFVHGILHIRGFLLVSVKFKKRVTCKYKTKTTHATWNKSNIKNTLTVCVSNSFFTRLRRVSLLQGRKDDRCVYTLERNWPPCSRHCNSILDKDTVTELNYALKHHVQYHQAKARNTQLYDLKPEFTTLMVRFVRQSRSEREQTGKVIHLTPNCLSK